MNKASTIGLDLAKQVFQVHGADATGAVVFRRRLRRTAVLQFFASQAPCRKRRRRSSTSCAPDIEFRSASIASGRRANAAAPR
jgi:transposase